MIHKPVLVNEAIDLLNLQPGGTVVDCTLGAGGHTRMILEKVGPTGKVLGIDRDESIVALTRNRMKKWQANLDIFVSTFSELESIAAAGGYGKVDAVLFDLGVSSYQLDDPGRGFSYQYENAVLDMRMGNSVVTAADILNNYDLNDLEKIFKNYGQIKRARSLAKRIISSRRAKSFLRVGDLREVVEDGTLGSGDARKILPRVWQSLRIEVNRELEELNSGLGAALRLLKKGGRVAVISFHSVEDGIVKRFFRENSVDCICPKDFPLCKCSIRPLLKIITKKAVVPAREEITTNNRSRSAKLRVAEKI